ncbi:MAG: insulinase family protein [Candidatus Riflebacteria bacterium]|nr:insulinase family protein [Candidatus Riflebacteria bacterium]
MQNNKTVFFIKLYLIAFLTLVVTTVSAEGAKQFLLDNGLNLYVQPVKTVPAVSVGYFVKAGSVNEEASEAGKAALTSSMLFSSSHAFPDGKLHKELRQYGISLSKEFSRDYSSYIFTSSSSNLERMLFLATEGMFNALFEASAFENHQSSLKQNNISEMSDPENILRNLLYEKAFNYHPYRQAKNGTQDSLANISVDKLWKFYQTFYLPSNAWVVIAGDVNPDKAYEALKNSFSRIQIDKVMQYIPPEPPQRELRTEKIHYKTDLSHVEIAWRVPGIDSLDTSSLEVLFELFSEPSIFSHFNDPALSSCQVSFEPSKYDSLFSFFFKTSPSKSNNSANDLISFVLSGLRENITAEKVEKAKRRLLAKEVFRREGLPNIVRHYGKYAMISTLDKAESHINKIKGVNHHDILRVLIDYFSESNLTIARIEPEQIPESALPEMLTLKNGLRLILKENHNIPSVSVSIKILAGSQRETSKNRKGVANFTAEMLDKGFVPKGWRSLDDFCKDKAIYYTLSCEYSYVAFDMTTLSENLIDSLEQFVKMLVTPSFPNDEIAYVSDSIQKAIIARDSTAWAGAIDKAKTAIFPGTSLAYSVLGTIDDVSKITKSLLLDFYKQHYIAPNIVVSIVGDFYSKEVTEKIVAILSDLPNGKVVDITPNVWKAVEYSVPAIVKDKFSSARILVANRTFPLHEPRTLPFKMLVNILNNQNCDFLRTRLVDTGILTDISVEYEEMVNDGCMCVFAQTNLDNANNALEVLEMTLEEFKNSSIDTTETNAAKVRMISEHFSKLASNWALASQLSHDEITGRGYAWYKAYENEISGITAGDLEAIKNEYFLATGTYNVTVAAPFDPALYKK